MACGILLCILTGGNVDLSVGATLCLSAALAATALQSGKSPVVAIIMAMAAALVIGLFQGILIGYIHVPPFICTLAGMFLYRGLARAVLDSKTCGITNEKFLDIFSSYLRMPGEKPRGSIHFKGLSKTEKNCFFYMTRKYRERDIFQNRITVKIQKIVSGEDW